ASRALVPCRGVELRARVRISPVTPPRSRLAGARVVRPAGPRLPGSADRREGRLLLRPQVDRTRDARSRANRDAMGRGPCRRRRRDGRCLVRGGRFTRARKTLNGIASHARDSAIQRSRLSSYGRDPRLLTPGALTQKTKRRDRPRAPRDGEPAPASGAGGTPARTEGFGRSRREYGRSCAAGAPGRGMPKTEIVTPLGA